MTDLTAQSKRTLDRAFALDVGCNNANPPEVIAALISIALLAIGGVVVALWRRIAK